MKNYLKPIVLTLAAALFLPYISSCAQENVVANETTTAISATDATKSTTEARILPNLGDANFDGYTFTVLTNDTTSIDWLDWIPRDIEAETETADSINDAVYRRNRTLEDRYNFVIKQNKQEDARGLLKKTVGAGLNEVDLFEDYLRETVSSATAGLLLDLNQLPSIDFDQPWWDHRANSSLSIGGRLFFTSGGNMQIVNYDASGTVLFNKKILADNVLEDPYELVLSGKWTMDKLYDMAKAAAINLDGNPEMDYQYDRFGLITQRDSLISLLHNSGETITTKDEHDMPIISFGSERSINALEKAFDLTYDPNITFNAHSILDKVEAIYPITEKMFQSDQALFMWIRLRIVQNLRNMETEFGILPIPKYDENQKDYFTTVNMYTGQAFAVPQTADPDRTGFILEAINAESKYTVMPAYYETTLKTKVARDNESQAMLDIIFNSTVYDLGAICDWGGLNTVIVYAMDKYDRTIASKFEKSLPRMEKAIEQAVNKIMAIE
ncbi:hypothetical protein FACS1894219_07170 [Clostridia bacterium]|nr:hypothetical protein FACS1894219_07170 [Clostridia bacterium]